MAFRTISEFKSRLRGGGARPNLFEVVIPTMPQFVTGYTSEVATNFSCMCESATLPSSSVNTIEVPFRGRTLKVAGDRTFATWNVTIINDEDFAIRTAFEQWMNGINQLGNATGATNPSSYMVNATVNQYGRGANQGRFSTRNDTTTDIVSGSNPTPLRTYTFVDLFPSNIGEISLSYELGNDIEKFPVEFQYQYFTIGTSPDLANTPIQ
jgi:hypothetical protein